MSVLRNVIGLSMVFLSVLEVICHTLLLASDRGVHLLTVENISSTAVYSSRGGATASAFRYNQSDVFFLSQGLVWYSYYTQLHHSDSEPIAVPLKQQVVRSIAVDREAYRLYYVAEQDGREGIFEAALLGADSKRIYTPPRDKRIANLVVDPYERLLFFNLNNSTVMTLHLHSRQVSGLNLSATVAERISHIAVDLHSLLLYAVTYASDGPRGSWSIVRTGYSSHREQTLEGEPEVVYSGSELEQASALDVLDNEIVWSTLTEDKYSLFSCKVYLTCDRWHLKVIPHSFESIYDVKFYNGIVQGPPNHVMCERLGCSHSCHVIGLHDVTCSCPEGKAITDDGITCRDEEPGQDQNFPWWLRRAVDSCSALLDVFLCWLSSLSSEATFLVYVTCLLFSLLLLCGFCMVPRLHRDKISKADSSELLPTRHRHSRRTSL